MTPTERSLAHLRKEGFTVQKVERWQSFFGRTTGGGHAGAGRGGLRIDLFGCIDLIAMKQGQGIVGIQCGAISGHSGHVRKILEEPRAKEWIQCGGRLIVHSWGKQKAGTARLHYVLKEQEFGVNEAWVEKPEQTEKETEDGTR